MTHGLTKRRYSLVKNWRRQRGARTTPHRVSLEALEPRRVLSGDPLIAEFQAVNDSTLQDEDGDFSDWIEIRNLQASPIDLDGWYLTDDAADLRKWQFPSTSVDANDEVLVFASNKDRANPGGELHSNFRLSGNGEYLALVKPDGITVAHDFGPAYPPQSADQSYGIATGLDVTYLVERGGVAHTFVPVDDSLADLWTQPDFDDNSWSTGAMAVGFEQLRPGFDLEETFDSGLGPEWTVDIPEGAESTVTVVDGKLVIDTASNQRVGDRENRGLAPVVYRDIPADATNYDLITKVDTPTRGVAGIVLHDAASNQAVLRVEYQRRSSFRLLNGDDDIISTVRVSNADTSFLRLQRDGLKRTWTAYYRLPEDETWTVIGSINDSSPDMVPIVSPAAGVNVHTTSAELTASFDSFTISVSDEPQVYRTAIGHDVETELAGVNGSIYIRIPFTVEDPTTFSQLSMAAFSDDGYRAFLNGTEIATQNAPDDVTWNSTATADFGAEQGQLPRRTMSLAEHVDALREGQNVLAVQGMNVDALDADFFFDVALAASTEVPQAEQAFVTATPGEPNTQLAAPAPIIRGQQGIFFGSTTVQLAVENADPAIGIFYTTDGRAPTLASRRYDGPITLTDSSMLQTRSFDTRSEPMFAPSPTTTGTFISMSPELQDRSSDLPLLVLDTLGQGIPNSSSTTMVPVNTLMFSVDESTGRSSFQNDLTDYLGRAGIRDRGSSTSGQPKPNLSFEIWGPGGTNQDDDFDASLAGLPAESDWVLHAPFGFDVPMIRNQMFFELANSILPWATHFQPVEVYLNRTDEVVTEQDYVGLYVLMEKVKQGEDRVDITPISPDDSDPESEEITGGYIWKVDRQDPGEPSFTAGGHSNINWVTPKSPEGQSDPDQKATPEQNQWVMDYFDSFAASLVEPDLHDPEGYSKYINVDSWVDNHLINVLTFNVDALRLSAYLFKDRGEKIEYGPPWDCDRCMDAAADDRDDNPEQWYNAGGTDFFTDDTYGDVWFAQLFQDPSFWQLYIDRWHELRQTLWSPSGLDDMIDRISGQIEEAQARNYVAWPPRFRDSAAFESGKLDGTWRGEVEHLRAWLHTRAAFMDRNFVGTATVSVGGVPLNDVAGVELAAGTEVQIDPRSVTEPDDLVLVSSEPGAVISRYFVPGDNSLGTAWTEVDFDDSEWMSGDLGFGFSSKEEFQAIIQTVVNPREFVDGATTLMTRTEFQIDDLNQLDREQLVLRMKFEDGVVAYLNGQRVASENLIGDQSATPSWDSRGRSRPPTESLFFEDYDLTEFQHLLVPGKNVLSIQVLNSSSTSNDLLLVPELVNRDTVERRRGVTYYTLDGTDPRGPDGSPSSAAIVAEPDHRITVTENTRVFARAFDTADRGSESGIVLTDWGPPVTYNLITAPLTAVISEVHYNPGRTSPAELERGFNSDDFEFVELHNPTSNEVNLIGGRLTGGVDFEFIHGSVHSLAPSERLLVVANRDAFELRYGADLPVAGEYQGRLANNGERLQLKDGTGQSVSSIDYRDSDPWPASPDGVGTSLQRVSEHAVVMEGPSKYYDWQPSQQIGGTPGTADSPRVGVVINEVLANSAGAEGGDAIELFNSTAESIDVGGWYLSDSSDNFFKFQIPSPTVIGAGQYLVFDEGDFNRPGQPDGFALNSSQGDDVWLVRVGANQQLTTLVDELHFGASVAGESFARYPNATGRLAPAAGVTMGEANSLPRVGPVVITELQYNPTVSDAAIAIAPNIDSSDLEFVELHNPTTTPIELANWKIQGGIDINLDDAMTIPGGESLVVLSFNPDRPENANRLAAFRAQYHLPGDVLLAGGYDGQLSNQSDRIVLVRPGEASLDQPNDIPRLQEDEVLYDNAAPWPVSDSGMSLQRIATAAIGNAPSSWVVSRPTPGSLLDELPGDFDGDDRIDARDIDLLAQQLLLANPDPAFDVDGNGVVEESDRDALVEDVLGTSYGDANLDGVFDNADLVELFAADHYDDGISDNSGWAEGDFNGDGEFNSEDIVFVFSRGGFQSAAPATSADNHGRSRT